MTTDNRSLRPILAALFTTAVFLPLALSRFGAGDEGYYLYAAQEVAVGRLPYLDFFYPQMPLLPYAVASWAMVSGFGWISARFFALLVSAACAVLLYRLARVRSGRDVAGILAVLIFCSTDLVLGYFPVVKTYGLSVLLLLAAFRFAEPENPARKQAVAAGICAGLSVATRLHFAALLPIVCWALCRKSTGPRCPYVGRFGIGVLVGMSPALLHALWGSDVFVFNNLTYHALRNRGGLISGFHQKWEALGNLFGTTDYLGVVSYQFGFLLLAVTVLALWLRKFSPYFATALVLTMISLLPTPVYTQYFCVVVPFLAIEAGVLTVAALQRVSGRARSRLTAAVATAIVLYLAVVPTELDRYLNSGRLVPGVVGPSGAAHWSVSNLRRISQKLNDLTYNGEVVITSWPGYLVGTHASAYRGLENHFGVTVAHKLSPEQRKRFRIIAREELDAAIESGATRVVLMGYRAEKRRWKAALALGGYKRFKTDLRGVKIFLRDAV